MMFPTGVRGTRMQQRLRKMAQRNESKRDSVIVTPEGNVYIPATFGLRPGERLLPGVVDGNGTVVIPSRVVKKGETDG